MFGGNNPPTNQHFGDKQVAPNLDGIKGWLTVFAISRALDIAYVYGQCMSLFGFGPKDDAPELPN